MKEAEFSEEKAAENRKQESKSISDTWIDFIPSDCDPFFQRYS